MYYKKKDKKQKQDDAELIEVGKIEAFILIGAIVLIFIIKGIS